MHWSTSFSDEDRAQYFAFKDNDPDNAFIILYGSSGKRDWTLYIPGEPARFFPSGGVDVIYDTVALLWADEEVHKYLGVS